MVAKGEGSPCVLLDIQPSQNARNFQFSDVGSIKKKNVQAKQNRSLGQIWLKGCHSAVSGVWDNNH
jgi:hypothetical protein